MVSRATSLHCCRLIHLHLFSFFDRLFQSKRNAHLAIINPEDVDSGPKQVMF